MSTFQAVVQQLQKNNQDEATRDNAMVKSLELHGEQNRVGFNKLIEKITGELNGVKNTFDAAREEEANQQKEEKKLKSSEKVKENRVARFMKITYEGIKKLPGNLFKAVSKGMSKLMDTMKEYGKKGWEIAKKFLMVGALGALLAFMNSDLWKQVTETLGKIKDGFVLMWDGLKDIAAAFWDEDGNLDIVAGIKKTWEKVSAGFKRLSDGITNAFFDEEGNYRTDNIVGQLTLIATGLAGAYLAWKVLRIAIDGFKLGLAPVRFFGRGVWGAGRGAGGLFKASLRGIRGGFGLLGRGLSGLSTSLMDISTSWGETSKNAKKSGGWASKGVGGLRGRFGRLFRLVGRRGLLGLIAGAGVSMLALLDFEKTKGIFSDAAGGLTKVFGKAFDVVKNFGSAISDVAKSAGNKLKNVVDGAKKTISGDDTKVKKTDAEIEADKKAAALEAENKKKMAAFKKADMESRGNFVPKVTMDSAKLSKSLLKHAAKLSVKMVPAVGAAYGIWETGRRLLTGDFAGAGLEAAGIFAPSAFGLPADMTNMAADVYKDMFGTYYANDVVSNPKQANANMAAIASKIKEHMANQTAADGGAIEDVKSPYYGAYQDGRSYIKGGDNFQSVQTFTVDGMNDGNMQFGTSMQVR